MALGSFDMGWRWDPLTWVGVHSPFAWPLWVGIFSYKILRSRFGDAKRPFILE